MDFGDGRWLTGRKQHRCEGCLGPIPKGERHYQFKGMFEGDWQNWRMHEECHENYAENGYEEFMSGDFEMPARVQGLILGQTKGVQ